MTRTSGWRPSAVNAATPKAAEKAKIEGEKQWAADYHNPASPNYDKARVEREAAEAIANGECC